ncbi:carbohydrate ABC transporter permease [Candidatus Saganbacteria bacterium]|nr:carbohydrate ABC transporter permease [Candidatus Saganbacteria bacterium]
MGHLVISWVNYIDMWRNVDFGLYLRNSFFICGLAMVFAMVFATLAAYALSRFDFPGSKSFSMIILATQMVPGIMFLIPTYSNFVKLTEMTGFPIKGTYYGIVFVYSAFFVPFSIWILRGFFAAIPVELEEAARIDGCSPLQVFWHVALPLAIPGIIATGIYVFLQAWDELVFAWVLTSADTMTIPVGIRNFVGNYQNRFDLIMAAATVATIPVMILFFMLQKYIVKGLTAGAVKG